VGWDSVPWFVEGGAQHSANIARKLAYAAVGGQQGIIGATDLEVRELAVPGTSIRVYPGLCSIRNKTSGALNEMYLGSMISQDVVAIAATGGGGARSDMICARVENPFPSGEPWPDPADLLNGPYVKTVVISNVGNTAVVPPGGSGNALIPLARIDIPASTATIIQSYIHDLRKMAPVLQDSQRIMLAVPGQHTLAITTNAYIPWPNPPMTGTNIKVDIPEWATKCIINGFIAVVHMGPGNAMGDVRAGLGALRTGAMRFDYATPTGQVDRANLIFGGSLDIPAAMRGTTVDFVTEARSFTAAAGATAAAIAEVYSTVSAQVEFQAVPASNF
jgi:hypothetical protein